MKDFALKQDKKLTFLLPPGVEPGTEISLCPRGKSNKIIFNLSVGKSQRKRGWTSDYFALSIVLASVAWTHEFVFRIVPRHDASQVGAHSIQTKLLDRPFTSNDEVSWVALEALH